MSEKLLVFWIAGAALLTFGMLILGNLQMTIGVSAFSYSVAVFIAFVLFLLAGLCWISVAVATKHHHG
jgi:hypothetical protein